MIVSPAVCQRWRDRHPSWRPDREHFNPLAHEVFEFEDDATPKAFVERHHYAASYPAARFRFGLHQRFVGLVGVAVFSVPMHPAVLAPWSMRDAVELGRLVLLDEVPANAESCFVRRCLDLLARKGLAGVVSFSDPEPRTTADGRLVFVGHAGTVYAALNARYAGRASPRTLRLLPDARSFSARAASKIRSRERGWEYAVEQLVAQGAVPPAPNEDLRAWLPRELKRVTVTMRHYGNHKYLWGLTPGAQKMLPAGSPYPKLDLRACVERPQLLPTCARAALAPPSPQPRAPSPPRPSARRARSARSTAGRGA